MYETLQEVSWNDSRNAVFSACPDLAKIIDEMEPGNELPLIKALYSFGDKIVDNGRVNLPLSGGESKPLDHPRMPAFVRDQLDYSSVPLGVVVKNNTEVYREMDERIFSIAYYGKGLDIGIWEHFGWTTPYSLTAGARSLYMLPRITLASGHKRLKRDFGVTLPAPKRAFDHWAIFKQIAASPAFNTSWQCEVYFFTQKWVEKLRAKPQQLRLSNYLIEKGWQHSAYGRRRSLFDIVWESFARALNVKGLKPNPYVLDTLKHLAFVSTGGSPASAPSDGTQDAGPLDRLQEIYISEYDLDYAPTIMRPCYFMPHQLPVYYSLQTPSLLESVPKSRNLTSIIDNVRELNELTKYFLNEAFDENLKIANVSINEMIRHLKFDYFHSEAYTYGKSIRPSKEMPGQDKRLIYVPPNNLPKKFADSSVFLHGCVRISTHQINQATSS